MRPKQKRPVRDFNWKVAQEAMAGFVRFHDLVCFRCGRSNTDSWGWGKTGVNKKGPWAICASCMRKPKPQEQRYYRRRKPKPKELSPELAAWWKNALANRPARDPR
jgi:hypothetical protein